MKTYEVNENCIITISQGKVVVWNLDTGEQYELFERCFLDRIYEIATADGAPCSEAAEDEKLSHAKLIREALDTHPSDISKSQQAWGWDDVAKIFHLGSKHNFPSDLSSSDENPEAGYLDFCESIAGSKPILEIEREGACIPLPAANLSGLTRDLRSVFQNRKTSRHFKKSPLELSTVSDLLFTTFGKFHGDSHQQELAARGVKTVGYRKTSPSAGCLQATEAYLVALDVKNLPSGVYHYRAHSHCLTLIRKEIHDLGKSLCHQDFACDASLLVIMTSRFDKLWWKYPHSRAYRSALLDVGHLSQTFNLVATAYNLNTWVTGYFIDDMLNDLIQVDGIKEHTIFVAAAGSGFSDPLSPNMKKLL